MVFHKNFSTYLSVEFLIVWWLNKTVKILHSTVVSALDTESFVDPLWGVTDLLISIQILSECHRIK